ncbi:MAG TPA: integrin alpha, partial [Myxococcota bacterium]|nr:integrin alpha [Myxococcota bacterium]
LAAGAPEAWNHGEIQIYHSNHGNLSPREVWTGQRANGNFGCSMAELGDPDGNGVPTLAVGAKYEGGNGNGAVLLAEADAVDKNYADLQAMLGPDNAKAGFALANVGDVDGDGQEDLLVGSDSYPYTSGRTVTWLVTAPIAGNLDDVAQATWTAEALEDSAGTVVGGAGDVDGDGHMDLLVGAPESDRGGNYGGVAYLLLANPSGTTNLAASDAVIVGSSPNTMYAGVSIAAIPDIDGDTQTDIAVGAYSASDNGRTSGTVYLLSGTVRGTVTAHTSAHTWLMGESTNYAGRGVGQAGDWDGDGVSELWVSSSNYNQGRGAIWGVSLAGPP